MSQSLGGPKMTHSLGPVTVFLLLIQTLTRLSHGYPAGNPTDPLISQFRILIDALTSQLKKNF